MTAFSAEGTMALAPCFAACRRATRLHMPLGRKRETAMGIVEWLILKALEIIFGNGA
jgi:hypothetical protein